MTFLIEFLKLFHRIIFDTVKQSDIRSESHDKSLMISMVGTENVYNHNG